VKTGYLVIVNDKYNEATGQFRSFKERYQIFIDPREAIEHAVKYGFEDPYHQGVSRKIGIGTVFMQGDVNITILPIEIQPRKVKASV
jgi:hypothetical protein